MKSNVPGQSANQEDGPVFQVIVKEMVGTHSHRNQGFGFVFGDLSRQPQDCLLIHMADVAHDLRCKVGGVLFQEVKNRPHFYFLTIEGINGKFALQGQVLGQAGLIPGNHFWLVGVQIPGHKVAPLITQTFGDDLPILFSSQRRSLLCFKYLGVFQPFRFVILNQILWL
ncbi:MAG: hypothetical protein DDT18_01947 [Actinobacteria bacterium]|nr:hypothetical protein [Actinomycetota bacterium]